MDKTRFLQACQSVMDAGRQMAGIGTLGEKTLHAVLKTYFDPDPAHHEVRTGRYVADVRNESGFVEIQTRQFYRLKGKLEAFLQEAPVTVVYPVPAKRWLIWLEGNGAAEPRRKAGRQPTACAVLPELYSIKNLLSDPRLRVCVLLMEVEDYRIKDGYGKEKKKHATKFDRLPVDLIEEICLTDRESYRQLIPDALPEQFTSKEYGKAARLTAANAGTALNVLYEIGAVDRCGKKGNAYLYRRSGL